MLRNRRLPLRGASVRQFCFSLLIAALILFGTHHPVFSVAAFGLCCLSLLLARNSYVISLLFFVMPMAGIFKLAPEQTSLFTYWELLYVILHLYKKKFRVTYGDLLAVFFGAYIVITGSLYTSLIITRTIKLVMNLLLIGYFAELNPEREHRQLFLYYIFGIIVASVMQFADSSFFPISEYVKETKESYGGMTTIRFSGLYGDPNYYSINLIIALCLLIVLYRRGELRFFTVVGLMVPLVLFVGLTGSKSSFLMLMLPMLLLVYVCIQNRNYPALLACVFGMILIVFFVIQGSIPIFSYVLLRLGNLSSGWEALTTGRTAIWREYLQFLAENPVRRIFGTGASIEMLDNVAAHNTYIECIYLFGVLGTGLYLMALYFNLRKRKRFIHRNIVNYSVFLTIGVMYAFLSELLSFDLPFHLALAGMVWNLDQK